MLRQILPIILEFAFFYFLIGQNLLRLILPKRKKNSLMVKDFHDQVKKIRLVNSDQLSAEALTGLDETLAGLEAFRAAGNYEPEATAKALQKADEQITRCTPKPFRKRGAVTEYLEILIVALGVAFGIRAIFLQPFKIPTGSMQPTLYGIHYIADEDMVMPGPLKKAVYWLHYSRRYVDLEIKESGFIRGYRPASSHIPILFPQTAFVIGSHEYILPGKPVDAAKCNPKLNAYFHAKEYRGVSVPIRFEQGETLAKGYLMSGDHIFVNRTDFNYIEPKRGDITVFMTDGIMYNGQELRKKGRYYIKRMVGLPGDELKINADNQLLVKEPGQTDFRPVNGTDSPAFPRINSGKGGYHGHVADMKSPMQAHLRPGTTYTVPPEHYFMLGDNSRHSLDSRFWGPVPRKNLVGKASLIWWPTTRRWGVADTTEPEQLDDKASSSGQVE